MPKRKRRFFNIKLKGTQNQFTVVKLLEMGLGLVFIICGVIFLMNKTLSDKFMATFLGILILLDAGLNIYSTFMPSSNKLFKINIVFGVLNVIMAILLFTNLIGFINYVVIYFGIYLIISGVKQLSNSIIFKITHEESWLIVLVMSLLVISMGFLMLFYPFASFSPLEIIAIFIILLGLLNINTANLLRNRAEKVLSKVDND